MSVKIPPNHPSVKQAFDNGLVVGSVGVNLHALTGQPSAVKKAGKPSGGGAAVVTLPVPPSTNNLFMNTKNGRVKTKEYRRWSELAAVHLFGVRPVDAYPVFVRLVCLEEVNQRRDADNMIKACLDACVAGGVLAGDSLNYVRGVLFEYRPEPDGVGVSVSFSTSSPC